MINNDSASFKKGHVGLRSGIGKRRYQIFIY